MDTTSSRSGARGSSTSFRQSDISCSGARSLPWKGAPTGGHRPPLQCRAAKSSLGLMFGMSAAGELAEEGPTLVLENVDQAHSRRVESVHRHLFNQPVKPEAGMRLCSGDL